jgi:erythromycin esterase-like protein
VLVFAHNAHVMNDHLAGGKWDAVARAPDTLGRFLRSMFADDLVIVGTSSALVDRDGIELVPDGLDAMLARVGEPLFLLDLRTARDDPAVAQWLAQPRSLRANISSEQIVTAARAFDLMLFIDRLTRAARQ